MWFLLFSRQEPLVLNCLIPQNSPANKGEMYSGIVWLFSLALIIYAVLSLTNQNVPDVEQLVDYPQTLGGFYIYAAAFFRFSLH